MSDHLYKTLPVEALLADCTAKEYEKWQDDIYPRLIAVNRLIGLLERFDWERIDVISKPDERLFWQVVARSFWHVAVADLHGLLNDYNDDVRTIPRLKNQINKWEWLDDSVKSEYRQFIKGRRLDASVIDLCSKVREVRNKLYSHATHIPATGIRWEPPDPLYLGEVRRLCDEAKAMFAIVSLGDFVDSTSPYLYSLTGSFKEPEGRSGLETILDALAGATEAANMPAISRFFGIVIAMFYADHNPPHFHARYGEQEAVFEIDTLALLAGELSPKARALVAEWASIHEDELRDNWERARKGEPLEAIEPLD
jgi:hypothetical protein